MNQQLLKMSHMVKSVWYWERREFSHIDTSQTLFLREKTGGTFQHKNSQKSLQVLCGEHLSKESVRTRQCVEFHGNVSSSKQFSVSLL